MADVIYKKGQSSNLNNVQIKEGQILVTEDTGEMYIDVTDKDRKKINGLSNSKLGSAIRIDDISPVTHEMSVKISSDTVTDLTAVKVTRCGKNLLYNDTVKSESTKPVYKKIWSGNLPAPFVFSEDLSQFTPTEGLASAATFRFKFADGTEKVIGKDYEQLLVTTGILKEIYFVNNTEGIGTIKCQLEIGTVKTDYEPYVGTDYTPNADGTVNGITSLYPNTTLITDTDGVIIDCEYLTKNYKINGLSNSKLGSAIRIDDISPVTHEMSVKISSDTITDLTTVKVTRCGKNLIPLPYTHLPIGTTTLNGIEFTVYEDGSILMNGTATTSFTRYLYNNKQDLLGLRAGDIITGSKWVSDYNQKANFNLTFNYYNIDGNMKEGAINLGPYHRNLTTTITEDYVGWGIYLYILSGKTFDNLLIKPQLELGKTATDYEPYVEPTEYTPNADGTVSGVTSLYPNTTLMTDTEDVLINCEYLTKSYAEIIGSTNLRNGSSIGSVRAVGSKEEDSSYKLGKYSMAEGLGTQSGAKAFTILGVDKTNKTYTLDSTEGLAIGDVYSVHVLYTTGSSAQGENYGKITAINGNVVTVDNLFCDNDFATADSYTDDGFDNEKNMFRIISKPNVGTRFIADVVHSEGVSTKALSKGSHAEGKGTTAYGSWSHAEGNNTKAGYGAHAEGSGTTASGVISHAEGRNTTSSGSNSHAEGEETIASGGSSHAEGYKTVASGGESHAEGSATKALGNKAHAEGFGTTALGDSSHAEGSGTNSSAYSSHAEGSSTTASGVGSHAEGRDTIASKDYSHAEGEGTKISSYAAHVQGRYNIDNNNYADIIGNGYSDTERSNAYTMDWNGNAWFAGDVYTKSTSGKNKDEGSKKLATEEYVNTISKKLTTNLVDGSSVGSIRTIGSRKENSSYTLGQYSVAEGNGTTASGDGSHAEGGATAASGSYSHAEGTYTEASGQGSHAEGTSTTASGSYSHAEGYDTIASGKYSHAQGIYNISDPAYADVIGNGTTDTKRSNAYTMDWKGNAWFAGDIYVGSTSGTNKDAGSKKVATVDLIYPVGSIYMSVKDTSPSTLFGGEWERIKDRFLLAAGDTYSAGSIDGEAVHKLTVAEMPSHNHTIKNRQGAQVGAYWNTPPTTSQDGGTLQDNVNSVVNYAGGGKSHNNMPPYLAVYMWKRMA